MYIVKLYNNGISTEIHGSKWKLTSGNLVKGISAIDSFTFSIIPSNPGFEKVQDYSTLVTIYNENKRKIEFYGRVLHSSPNMDETGAITKEVVCESYLGFLCDSKQKYVDTRNWTVGELWEHIIAGHNAQVEPYKHFALGDISVTDTSENIYIGIQREDTWKTLNSKLVEKLGGEIRFRVADGVTYIDHVKKLGETRATKIALSHNMKSIRQDNDPTAYISRLIPLGAKIKDEEGNETEERIDITSVNDGKDYIDDVDAIAAHGIRVGYVLFDDVTVPSNLKTKGEGYLRENNRVKVKYAITALDLYLLGLDIDDFEVCDYYPIVNDLLGINDTARIIKKTVDITDDTKSTIEVGDRFKTLSDIQTEQSGKVDNLESSVGKIESDYVTNTELISEQKNTTTLIGQTTTNILLAVEELYAKKTTLEDTAKTITAQLELLSDSVDVKITETEKKISNIDGDLQSKFNQIAKYFSFTINGLEIGATYMENGEEKKSQNKVVIDNDDITIYANGVIVQEFKADGSSLIPTLKVTKELKCLGLNVTENETHINCDYIMEASG